MDQNLYHFENLRLNKEHNAQQEKKYAIQCLTELAAHYEKNDSNEMQTAKNALNFFYDELGKPSSLGQQQRIINAQCQVKSSLAALVGLQANNLEFEITTNTYCTQIKQACLKTGLAIIQGKYNSFVHFEPVNHGHEALMACYLKLTLKGHKQPKIPIDNILRYPYNVSDPIKATSGHYTLIEAPMKPTRADIYNALKQRFATTKLVMNTTRLSHEFGFTRNDFTS